MKYDDLLKRYISGVDLLNARVSGLTEKDWSYRPDRPGSWTLREHVIHLADNETNGFIRCKSIIAQPNTECYVMDEELWTGNLKRKNEDVDKYLSLFGLVRRIVYDLVKDEPEKNWTGDYFIRTINGKTEIITLEKCIEIYCSHLDFHLEYIDRIKEEIKAG